MKNTPVSFGAKVVPLSNIQARKFAWPKFENATKYLLEDLPQMQLLDDTVILKPHVFPCSLPLPECGGSYQPSRIGIIATKKIGRFRKEEASIDIELPLKQNCFIEASKKAIKEIYGNIARQCLQKQDLAILRAQFASEKIANEQVKSAEKAIIKSDVPGEILSVLNGRGFDDRFVKELKDYGATDQDLLKIAEEI